MPAHRRPYATVKVHTLGGREAHLVIVSVMGRSEIYLTLPISIVMCVWWQVHQVRVLAVCVSGDQPETGRRKVPTISYGRLA